MSMLLLVAFCATYAAILCSVFTDVLCDTLDDVYAEDASIDDEVYRY
jgi:hypothetical protein